MESHRKKTLRGTSREFRRYRSVGMTQFRPEHTILVDVVVLRLSRDIAIFLSGAAGVQVKAAGILGQKS